MLARLFGVVLIAASGCDRRQSPAPPPVPPATRPAMGSPVITIPTTGAIPSGGKSVTFAPGGGTAPYSITDATGLTLTKSGTGGEVYHATGASSDGTNVTVTFDTPIPQGTTVTLAGATGAGATLTDSAGNTIATGQTGRAVTNNSTAASTAYNLSNAGLVVAAIDQTATNSLNGVSCSQIGAATEIRFVATGTDCWALGYSFGTTSFSISVDGGSFSAPTHVSGNIAVPLFSGLSDAAHTVVIRRQASSYIALTNAIRVFGASPSVAKPSGYGTVYPLKTAGSFITSDPVLWKTSDGNQVPGVFASGQNNNTFGFVATVDTIKVYGYQEGQKIEVQVDGAAGSLYTAPNTATYGWMTVATGLDAAAPHTYRFAAVNSPTINALCDVTTSGGTGIATAAMTARPSLWFPGDSIVNAQFPDARAGDAHKLGLALNYAVGSFGTNGAKMPTAAGSGLNGQKPSVVVVCYGTNDCGLTPTAQATFQANTQSYLTALRTTAPAAKIVVRAILPRSDNSTYNDRVTAYNPSIQAAIAAVGDANTYYRDFSLGFAPATHTSDGLHPNDAGYTIIANNEIPYFAGLVSGTPGYTVAVAPTGVAGSPATITYTRIAGTTWATGETVTTDDGAGGTFGAFSHSNGTTATRTYTPASAGAKTLTSTSGQAGWADPAPAAFTATAGASGVVGGLYQEANIKHPFGFAAARN